MPENTKTAVNFTAPPFADDGVGGLMLKGGYAYLEDYVLDCDSHDHEPTEFERALLEDFMNGLLNDEAMFGPVRTLLADHAAQAETIAPSILLLREMADLMEGVISGEYTPDSFTTQPARVFLAKFAQPCSRCRGEGCVQVGSPESWSLEDCLDCDGTGRVALSKVPNTGEQSQ